MGATTSGPVLSRRQMLVAAGMTGLAGVVPALRCPVRFPFHILWGAGGSAPASASEPGDGLALAQFAPHVGTRFTAQPQGMGPVALTLEEATPGGPYPADPAGLRGEAFSLVFRAAGRPPLPDGIHRLHHPALGTFPLFLSAFGAARQGQGYQAVVDLRRPAR